MFGGLGLSRPFPRVELSRVSVCPVLFPLPCLFEVLDHLSDFPQVIGRFPCIFVVGEAFPFDEVFGSSVPDAFVQNFLNVEFVVEND